MKQENCCTPEGQIKRYKDCIGCDKKPKQEMAGKAFYESADKVIIVKRQETLEEAAKKYAVNKSSSDIFRKAHAKDFIAGAKWQAESVPSIIEQKWLEYRDSTNNEDAWCFKEWLVEQFKKK
jgi:hypothetical protein